jgi:hypothetical protein
MSDSEGTIMSIDMPAALEARPTPTTWLETALAVVFAASAVLLVSFVAVVTGVI